MTLLGNGFRRILILTVIAICVVLIALNIIINIKLRAELPNLITEFSEQTPYDIEVSKIGIDLLFRVKLSNVSVSDPTLEIPEIVKVKKLTVVPRILPSIFNQRIDIGEIVLKGPRVESNKENIDKLIDFINTREKDDKGTRVELGVIRLVDSELQVNPDLMVYIPSLFLDLSNKVFEQGRQIKFGGDIELVEKRVLLSGNLKTTPEKTTGEINLSSADFMGESSDGKKLNTKSTTNFEISELITLDGKLLIDSESGIFSEQPFADASYRLEYDSSNDLAQVKMLDIKLNDILEGSFSGQIDKLTKETVFELSGEMNQLNINSLFIKIFGDDKGFVSGQLNSSNLKIVGSRAKEDIRLIGDANVTGLNFNSEDENQPSIDEVNCDLKVNQSIMSKKSFSLTANGTCNAEKFLWDKTGPVENIKARVNLKSNDRWIDNKITLTNITSSYMDGSASGTLEFVLTDGFGGGITTISGDINASNLNLVKTPKTIIPANIEGTAQTASGKFSGGSSNYSADISIAITDFILKSKKGREFRVSNLNTNSALDFQYKSLTGDEQKDDAPNLDEILIKGGGVAYQGLSFEEYNINSGTVKEFEFLLELGKNSWALDMASMGSGFKILGHDVSLERFDENLSIRNSGREGFKGTVNGTDGRYKSVEFPTLSWNYNFINDRIIVSEVSTQISTIGLFKTDELFVNIGAGLGGYPYEVNFSDAAFEGFEGKLYSEGITGEFTINKPGATELDWHGRVDILKTKIVSAVVSNISNKIVPITDGINLKDLTGQFLGGDISGNINIDTTTSPSGIDVDLKLLGAKIDSPGTNISLTETDLTFSGTLPNGALPEGRSKLELKNMILDSPGATSSLSGEIDARTIAETLYIDQGFIKGKSQKELTFTGEMTDSLNENRTLNLQFPEVFISDALGLLSPLVPEDFRDFKTQGTAQLNLEFDSIFFPQGTWTGKLKLTNGSFSGEYGGGLLIVQDVNGTITIKDEVSSENPLAKIVGEELKLSKSIFQKYLKSFNETNLDDDLDFLNIQSVEYGVLKFENVEAALEVDRSKINLRKLLSKMFRGSFYGAGLITFGGAKTNFNLSMLFNEISLEGISERVSPGQEYITGRVNGLIWLSAEGADLDTVDGPFKFWSKRSSKEQRRIGAALLAKMGARERLVLGSSRSYDSGDISGYINDGLITFRQFEISNSILGIRNLTIQADAVRNSISINQLISTVRELTRRSESGLPMIETN